MTVVFARVRFPTELLVLKMDQVRKNKLPRALYFRQTPSMETLFFFFYVKKKLFSQYIRKKIFPINKRKVFFYVKKKTFFSIYSKNNLEDFFMCKKTFILLIGYIIMYISRGESSFCAKNIN